MMTAGNVSANLMKFTDEFDAGHTKMNWLDEIAWEFDLKEDGFDPQSMEVLNASIELEVEDDNNDLWFFSGEWAGLFVGESETFVWEVDSDSYKFEISCLLTLNEEGILSASLVSLVGDFYFNSAALTAIATPEPNTISMICFGLIGLLGFRYGRKKH
jgi:hypothetical protein